MPEVLAVFLHTFFPRRICHACLAKLLGDPATQTRRKLDALHRSGRVEVAKAVCLNCDETRSTVRVAPGQEIEGAA